MGFHFRASGDEERRRCDAITQWHLVQWTDDRERALDGYGKKFFGWILTIDDGTNDLRDLPLAMRRQKRIDDLRTVPRVVSC